MLPDEMWESVLNFLDAFELIKLKRVSKHWCELITGVIERECKWYQKCVEVVPEDTWSSILEHHTHPEIRGDDFHRLKKHSEIWMSLYRSWIGWKTLAERNWSTESVVIFKEVKRDISDFHMEDWNFGISCLDVKGSVIAVGTGDEGRVIFYNISNFPGEPIFEAHHEFTVIAVCLGRVDGDTIAVANSEDGETKLKFWNLRTKTPTVRIVSGDTSRNKWTFVRTSFEYCHMVEDHSEAKDDPRYIFRLERMGSGIDLHSMFVNVESDFGRFIVDVSADRSKITLMSGDPDRDTFYFLHTGDSNHELQRVKLFESHHLGDTYFFPVFTLFRPGVVAFINEDEGKEFGFLIEDDKWKQYDVERNLGLHFSLKCILYHVGILILGCTLGYVLMIDVKNVDGLFKLDLKTMRYRLMKLDVNHKLIKYVRVTEYNSHQYLVAATDEKVYLVKFDRKL